VSYLSPASVCHLLTSEITSVFLAEAEDVGLEELPNFRDSLKVVFEEWIHIRQQYFSTAPVVMAIDINNHLSPHLNLLLFCDEVMLRNARN